MNTLDAARIGAGRLKEPVLYIYRRQGGHYLIFTPRECKNGAFVLRDGNTSLVLMETYVNTAGFTEYRDAYRTALAAHTVDHQMAIYQSKIGRFYALPRPIMPIPPETIGTNMGPLVFVHQIDDCAAERARRLAQHDCICAAFPAIEAYENFFCAQFGTETMRPGVPGWQFFGDRPLRGITSPWFANPKEAAEYAKGVLNNTPEFVNEWGLEN
jgi:hypothetical protein